MLEVLCTENADPQLPDINKPTFYVLAKEMEFTFEKRNRKTLLIELDGRIVWRHYYLGNVRQHRKEK